MRIEPEFSGVQIVLRGNFNPAIFTPSWFALYGLLPNHVAENANLQVAHKQLTAFHADWLSFQVSTDWLQAATMQAPHVRVHDLTARLFGEHLIHTPITAMGINRDVHFAVGNLKELDRIGNSLAPTSAWGDWEKELDLRSAYGGMTSLRMSQLHPKEKPQGSAINITIEPSSRIGNGKLGVYVGVNNHFPVDFPGQGSGVFLRDLLASYFDQSLSLSNRIVDYIMSLASSN